MDRQPSGTDTWIGDVVGELRVNAANGKIAVDRPQSAVFVKTANGDIVLGAGSQGFLPFPGGGTRARPASGTGLTICSGIMGVIRWMPPCGCWEPIKC